MAKKKNKLPVRIPTPKPTVWHKDKSKYDRKKKHKNQTRAYGMWAIDFIINHNKGRMVNVWL